MFQRWTSFAAGLLSGLTAAGLMLLILSSRKRIPIELHPPPTPGPVQIHVAGAVENPGVYTLPRPAISVEAIHAAGGPLEKADLDRVNLAAELEDGQRLYVPFLPESGAAPAEERPAAALDPRSALDINTATLTELETLPGIGPSLAQKIIDYRETHGLFNSVEELLSISGIGPAKLDQIREMIRAD